MRILDIGPISQRALFASVAIVILVYVGVVITFDTAVGVLPARGIV